MRPAALTELDRAVALADLGCLEDAPHAAPILAATC
jgi:hypothetical protein